MSFDLDDIKSELLEILKLHSDSLVELSLSRNKVSNDFIEAICASLHGGLKTLKEFDLRHLKEIGKINWIKMLSDISNLSKRGQIPLQVKLSDYQTQLKR